MRQTLIDKNEFAFSSIHAIDESLREEILDLWCAVNNADGAVGFYPGAPRHAVGEAIDAHCTEMADGGAWFYTLRGPAVDNPHALLSIAWWVTGTDQLFRHVATLKRLMTHPARQGEGIGSLMLDHLHQAVAEIPHVELLHLQFRTGRRLHQYYARWGYECTNRAPATIKLPDGSYRGSGEMMRTIDGSPLPKYVD